MTSQTKLLATYFTLAGEIHPLQPPLISPVPFEVRAATAAEAGFRGMGISVDDLAHLAKVQGLASVRKTLAENGLDALEIESLTDWFTDGLRRDRADTMRSAVFEMAAELGPVHIKALGDMSGADWSNEALVDEFGKLCDEAQAVGTRIAIEVFPGSGLPDIYQGREVVEGANHTAGGLLIDIWHVIRGGVPLSAISELRPQDIFHVELNDGALTGQGSYLEDTVNRRRLCGEGQFPVEDFIKAIRATGYDGLWGVEVLSAKQRARSPEAAAQLSFETTRRALDSI